MGAQVRDHKNLPKMAMKMKSMMKAKAMKTMMKRMKAKKISKRTAVNRVFAGKLNRTKGGLTKAGLVKNKSGRVVSKKLSARGKASKWIKAVTAARKALGVKGFCVIGGKAAKGQALLKKARSLYK